MKKIGSAYDGYRNSLCNCTKLPVSIYISCEFWRGKISFQKNSE